MTTNVQPTRLRAPRAGLPRIGVLMADLAATSAQHKKLQALAAGNAGAAAGGDQGNPVSSTTATRRWFERIEAAGLDAAWSPQPPQGVDVLTAIAATAADTRIELGTSVIPIFARHPLILAQQVLTTQAIVGNRLTLGLGLSHQPTIERVYGIPFDRPLLRMRECLQVLKPLLAGRVVSFEGKTVTARGGVGVIGAAEPSLLLAALGPQMLELAGTETDGTIVVHVGMRTLEGFTVPTISRAAAAAGRPRPRVVVQMPVWVTNNVAAAREELATALSHYLTLPSYIAMFEREGVQSPAELAIVGDETAVEAGIRRVAACGGTDLCAIIFGDRSDQERAFNLLETLASPN